MKITMTRLILFLQTYLKIRMTDLSEGYENIHCICKLIVNMFVTVRRIVDSNVKINMRRGYFNYVASVSSVVSTSAYLR